MYPKKFLYSKEHEWIKVEGDEAVVGITHHAQAQLGDIVYVDLPETGAEFASGEEFGSVESVKAVAEIYMPISGEVLEVNEFLEETPELVNQQPHDDGWIVRVKITDPSELDDLMDAGSYEEFVKQESE